MNLRFCILVPLTLVCATALAQSDSHTTTYQTAQGEVTVHSGQPAPRSYGPPPSFAQLDRRGSGFISADDADAYPPLANDFLYADANRDGRISKAEYERWAKSR
jgi:lipoprotein-anchoring transpeptidase ErfK/SrfK